MKVFDVHDRSLDITKAHLLEASAGTGKTYSIQHITTRLLLTGSIKIDQILLVTFTRAATRELKSRIRLNIEQALAALQSGIASEDYLNAVIENGQQDVASSYLKEALVCFDNAQILTIHAFCQRMLSEYAFEAGITFSRESVFTLSREEMQRRSVSDALRLDVTEDTFTSLQVRQFLKKFSLAPSVRALEEERALDTSITSIHEVLSKIPKLVAHCSKEKYLEDFVVLKKTFKGLTGTHIDRQIHTLAQIMISNTCTRDDLEALIEGKTLFLEPLLDEAYLRSKARMPENLHYPELYPLLKQELLPLIHKMRDPHLVAQHVLNAARQRYSKWNANPSFNTLIQSMHHAAQMPAFKAKIQARYQAVIIDEFQDTDAKQWEIFSQLFREGSQIMYLVGDPKQSIYGFRQADIYTYLKAPQEIPSMQRACLNTNYRSQPSLMTALNRLFSSTQWMHLPKAQTYLPYETVLASQKEDGHVFQDGLGALHFMLVEEKPSPRGKFPSAETERTVLFPHIAKKITHLCSQEKISYGNIAVLVRDRYQASNLQTYLQSVGIPSVLKRPKSLKEALSLNILQDILKAIDDPNSLPLLKQVLLSPVWDYSIAETQGAWENALLQEARLLFLEMRQIFLDHGFFVFLEKILRASWRGRRVLTMLVENDQEEIFHEWRQIADLLSTQSVQQLLTISGAIFALEEIKSAQPDEENKGLYAVQGSLETVTLMTSHMSKGLEFDIVFALGLCQRITRTKEEEAEGMEDEIALSLEEAQAEKLRLFYVAMTRAKKRVYLFSVFQNSDDPLPLEKASAVELYFTKVLGNDRVNFLTASHWVEQISTENKISLEVLHPLEELKGLSDRECGPPLTAITAEFPEPRSRKTLSFSSLAHGYKTASIPLKTEKSEELPMLPAGSETGQLVHGILEKIFKLHLYNPFAPEKILSLIQREIRNTAFAQYEQPLTQMIMDALQTNILPSFCLTQLPRGEFFCETEFMFSWNEHCIKGIADLTFRHQNKIYLLDWKTNDLGLATDSYSSDNIHLAMQNNCYFFQASLYREALCRYVKQFDNRPFEEIFGGALYFFLRGNACYHFLPEPLSELLAT